MTAKEIKYRGPCQASCSPCWIPCQSQRFFREHLLLPLHHNTPRRVFVVCIVLDTPSPLIHPYSLRPSAGLGIRSPLRTLSLLPRASAQRTRHSLAAVRRVRATSPSLRQRAGLSSASTLSTDEPSCDDHFEQLSPHTTRRSHVDASINS